MLNRRQFVQSATLAGMASALPGVASGAVEPQPQGLTGSAAAVLQRAADAEGTGPPDHQ